MSAQAGGSEKASLQEGRRPEDRGEGKGPGPQHSGQRPKRNTREQGCQPGCGKRGYVLITRVKETSPKDQKQ